VQRVVRHSRREDDRWKWSKICRHERLMLRLVALLVTLGWALACSSLPTPARATHPAGAFIEVPYPPPAALVEVVTKRPDTDSVWVDGNWVWRGRYYVWRRGGWLHAPPDAAYADWQAYLAQDGRLLFASGAWYDPQQQLVEAPRPLRMARTPPNQTTLETEVAR
jgi:hypothetical protein